MRKLRKVKPTYWEDLKTEGIDFESDFIWLDDYPFQAELYVLGNFGMSHAIHKVDLKNKGELLDVMAFLKGINEKKRKSLLCILIQAADRLFTSLLEA